MAPFDSTQCPHHHNPDHAPKTSDRNLFVRLFLPIVGLASLLWMLMRVIPKPSRAEYPCMKVAAPLASGFIAYVVGMAAALLSIKKARTVFREKRYSLALTLGGVGLVCGMVAVLTPKVESLAGPLILSDSLFVPIDQPNTPLGIARGIFPGRVVWTWDSTATLWNGSSGNWYTDANTRQQVVDSMFSRSLRTLTGKTTDAAAWDTLFKFFNLNHGKGNIGYQAREKVVVKLNLVTSSYPSSWLGNVPFAAPQTVLALARGLVDVVGVRDSDITFYDTDRFVPDPMYNKVHAAYPGIHFVGWVSSGGREQYVRDTTRVYFSHTLKEEINGGNPGYLPTVVTRASYLINLGSFKAHRYMGVTFCSKNHFGSLSASDSTGAPYQNAPHAVGLHYYAAVHDMIIPGSAEWTFKGNPMGSYNPLVDLMGHRDLGAKTLLFMIDGLYAADQEGLTLSNQNRWISAPFNHHWLSSLFMSLDNVALESVGIDFVRTEKAARLALGIHDSMAVYGSVDNYLHEAAQADNPPSGTFYHPNGDSVRLRSLGVHEHWNNAVEKNYSRNLGTGNGIELVKLSNVLTSVASPSKPESFSLTQNYPNPFNPTTVIRAQWSVTSVVHLAVYDVLGRQVAVLANGRYPAGEYTFTFDGTHLSSGVYFCRLTGERYTAVRKMSLIK